MSEHLEDDAFILRSTDYADRDLIVTLFAESTGRFSAIAKNARGSKRRFGGGLQPMRRLHIDCTDREDRDLARLDEIDVVDDYAEIAADFDKITVGSYATELTREITVERDPFPELFELLDEFYGALADAEADRLVLEVLLRHFELGALRLSGSAPALDACLRCGEPVDRMAKVYALRSGEGIVCPECRRTGDPLGVVYPETLEILRYFRAPDSAPPDALEDLEYLGQARRLVDAAVERVVERPLKAREMLDSVLRRESDR